MESHFIWSSCNKFNCVNSRNNTFSNLQLWLLLLIKKEERRNSIFVKIIFWRIMPNKIGANQTHLMIQTIWLKKKYDQMNWQLPRSIEIIWIDSGIKPSKTDQDSQRMSVSWPCEKTILSSTYALHRLMRVETNIFNS